MRRGFGPPHRPGAGWGPPGRGAAAWEGFGRYMFLGGLLFLAFTMFGAFALVALALAALRQIGVVLPELGGLLPLVVIGGIVLLIMRRFRRTWHPVRQLIGAAGALADGDYSVRVRAGGSASIRSVVASFNDMAHRLETADEQRRRLLADLGHELRTPLTVIRGEIEAMLDGIHTPDAEHLDMLIGEVAVMERLLEDLRTLSLIDAGSLTLHPEPTDVAGLLEDVADAHRRRAGEAGVVIQVFSGPGVGEVELDPVRMREVLANLVVNSLRAMPDGGALVLRAKRAGSRVVLDVEDTGAGIPATDVEHVFDRFHKGSTSQGSGLGLTISRDLVAAHGGEIALDSAPGRGTTVRIELPG